MIELLESRLLMAAHPAHGPIWWRYYFGNDANLLQYQVHITGVSRTKFSGQLKLGGIGDFPTTPFSGRIVGNSISFSAVLRTAYHSRKITGHLFFSETFVPPRPIDGNPSLPGDPRDGGFRGTFTGDNNGASLGSNIACGMGPSNFGVWSGQAGNGTGHN